MQHPLCFFFFFFAILSNLFFFSFLPFNLCFIIIVGVVLLKVSSRLPFHGNYVFTQHSSTQDSTHHNKSTYNKSACRYSHLCYCYRCCSHQLCSLQNYTMKQQTLPKYPHCNKYMLLSASLFNKLKWFFFSLSHVLKQILFFGSFAWFNTWTSLLRALALVQPSCGACSSLNANKLWDAHAVTQYFYSICRFRCCRPYLALE